MLPSQTLRPRRRRIYAKWSQLAGCATPRSLEEERKARASPGGPSWATRQVTLEINGPFARFAHNIPDVAVMRFSDAVMSVDSLRGQWTEIFKLNFNSKVKQRDASPI